MERSHALREHAAVAQDAAEEEQTLAGLADGERHKPPALLLVDTRGRRDSGQDGERLAPRQRRWYEGRTARIAGRPS